MRSLHFVAGLAIVFLSAEASAEWFPVSTSVRGAVWYMDAERVKIVDKNVQAWVKIDYSKDASVGWRETKELVSFDCPAGKYRTLSYINYDSYGKVVSSHSFSDYGYGIGYDAIVPDSVIESASKVACMVFPTPSGD